MWNFQEFERLEGSTTEAKSDGADFRQPTQVGYVSVGAVSATCKQSVEE